MAGKTLLNERWSTPAYIEKSREEKSMKMKLGTMAVAAVMAASPVMADLVFPSLSYRTGPYAAGGIPFADGYADYFNLLDII